jgi:predicted small secreted protein
MNSTLRKLAWLAILGWTVGGLAACNTVKGAGKDVEAAGEEIQETADDAKDHD